MDRGSVSAEWGWPVIIRHHGGCVLFQAGSPIRVVPRECWLSSLVRGESLFVWIACSAPETPSIGLSCDPDPSEGGDQNADSILLSQNDVPTRWYNVAPDLPAPLPPALHPVTLQPMGPADLAPLFPMDLIMQEVSQERYIDIPEEVREILQLWRPTPLIRAARLEKALGTPAKIFFKYEGVSPTGSHKPNTAVAQAYYNKIAGVKQSQPPRRAPASGVRPCPWPATFSTSNARSIWSR